MTTPRDDLVPTPVYALSADRPYVVTGAGSGVGLATTTLLVGQGARVIGVDLADRPAAAPEVPWVVGDVADGATWDRVEGQLAGSAAAALVSCAGATSVDSFLDTDVAEFERLFRVNTLGVLHGLRRLLPGMVAQGEGAVAVVASVDSLFVEEGMAAYSTSKGAMLQLVRSAAVEHARDGIRINAVCPGAIDTPMLWQAFATGPDPQATAQRVRNSVPTGRLIDPGEIAHLLAFLASRASSALSGAAVVADGGVTSTYDFRFDET